MNGVARLAFAPLPVAALMQGDRAFAAKLQQIAAVAKGDAVEQAFEKWVR